MSFRSLRRVAIGFLFAAAGAANAAVDGVEAGRIAEPARDIEIVIALDVSDSMSGLIDSAKQRLWDIVNELGRAQPQPRLRLAILSYGDPRYGAGNGYVRVDLPFTTDLDAVNRTLFSFTTNGGDEYVASAVTTAVDKLQWTSPGRGLRMLFVAGNEGAAQDPQITLAAATEAAVSNGIVVNTIYCGHSNDGDAAGWREVATSTRGLFASIDQHAAAVANIATPMDARLAELNRELNETYVVFGKDGANYRSNQLEQDANAASMSPTALASRAVAKAGALYDSSTWDLVDALEAGTRIEDIPESELPSPMQSMDRDEREAFVGAQAGKRKRLRSEIDELAEARRDFIAAEQARSATKPAGLDAAIQQSLRSLAESAGFTFDSR